MRENVHARVGRLLCSLFGSSSGVAQLLSRLDGGGELVRGLPNAANASLDTYCHELVQELARRGTLEPFFEPLMEAFPYRLRDLRVVHQQLTKIPIGSWLANDMGSEYAREQLALLQTIVSMAHHAVLESCMNATPDAVVRELFVGRWPTRDLLADWTAEKVHKLGFLAETAALLASHLMSIELGLAGKTTTLLKDVFPEKFAAERPVEQPERSNDRAAPATVPATPRPSVHEKDLGSITVKEALSRGLAEAVAFVVRQSTSRVEARMRAAHGKQYVRNLFWDEWPDEEAFGDYTVAQALRYHLVGSFAAITGLSYEDVRRHLSKLHSHDDADRILVRNVLHPCWPAADPGERGGALDLESTTIGELSRAKVPPAELLDSIAYVTGIKRSSEVEKRLAAATPEMRLRDVFPNRWPDWDGWMRLTAAGVLKHSLATSVARRLELDPRYVQTKLQAAHGNSQVGKLFEAADSKGAEARRLGDLTLAEVDRCHLRESLTDVLVRRGLLQKKGVTQRFNNNHGHSLVRNVFRSVPRDEWPFV